MLIDSLESRLLFAAGGLDPYFGSSGTTESGRFVLPAADGRIYTVAPGPGNGSATIRRIDTHGLLDPTYNVTLSPGRDFTTAQTGDAAPAIDSRGRVFVPLRGGIFCVNTNGKLDTSFGKGGVVNSPLEYSVIDIVVQRDDRIVIAGSQRKQNGLVDGEEPFFAEAAAVARLNANGTLDTTFGNKGVQLESDYTSYGLQAPQDKQVNDVAIDSSNRLVLLRQVTSGNDYNDYIISRSTFDVLVLNPNGPDDTSVPRIEGATQFHTDDKFGDLSNTQLHGRRPVKLTVDSSNRILLSLAEGDPETERPGIARLLPNGALDTAFGGGDGFAEDFFTDDHVLRLTDLFTLANGKIFLAVTARTFGAASSDTALIALNSDGTRDTAFGESGLVDLGQNRTPTFAGLARDGSILVSSTFVNTETNTTAYELKRFWRDSAPAAIASVKNITTANRSVTIDVAYRDDGSVNPSTLDSHDLRVSGPNGYAKYARFDSIVTSTNDNGVVVARYKLPAPGGTWAGRNGTYDVRLRDGQVFDTDGHSTATRTLASFVVKVAATSAPVAFHPSQQTIQRGNVFNVTALINLDELL